MKCSQANRGYTHADRANHFRLNQCNCAGAVLALRKRGSSNPSGGAFAETDTVLHGGVISLHFCKFSRFQIMLATPDPLSMRDARPQSLLREGRPGAGVL